MKKRAGWQESLDTNGVSYIVIDDYYGEIHDTYSGNGKGFCVYDTNNNMESVYSGIADDEESAKRHVVDFITNRTAKRDFIAGYMAARKTAEIIEISNPDIYEIGELWDAFDGFSVYGVAWDGKEFFSKNTGDLFDCVKFVRDSYDYSIGQIVYKVLIKIEVNADAGLITVTGNSYEY